MQTLTFWSALVSAIAAVVAARVGRSVNRAVNRVPKGAPTLVERVTEMGHCAEKIEKLLEVSFKLEGTVAQLSERVSSLERRIR